MKHSIPISKDMRCPFGVRDLKHDECYSGSGQNRCEFFVRYNWGVSGKANEGGFVECTCDREEDISGQLEFDF